MADTPTDPDPDRHAIDSFGDRLNALLAVRTDPLGNRWTHASIAAAMQATGVHASGSYISLIRQGVRPPPRLPFLVGLARVLDISPSYFIDDASTAQRAQHAREAATAMRAAGVTDLALRAEGLSDHSIQLLLQVTDRLRELEKLPPDGPDEMAAQIRTGRAAGPALHRGANGTLRPGRQVRLPTATDQALEQLAQTQGRTPSEVMRDAITDYFTARTS